MKLTVNSFYPSPKQLSNLHSGTTNPLSKSKNQLQQIDESQCINCNVFCFTNTLYETPKVIESYSESKETLPKGQESKRKTMLEQQKSQRRHKICLSLNQNPSKRELTQKKQSIDSSWQNRWHSQQKKQEALLQYQRIKKGVNLFKKFKTEPSQLQKLLKKNQLKESLKLSTNIMTPGSESLKQSLNSFPKKAKLSLSNDFKSSINKPNLQPTLKINPSCSSAKYYETIPLSQQVYIQQSFITAKLHNIYEQINDSFLPYSYSNIIQYNKIMANQQIWKHPGTASRGQINPENEPFEKAVKKQNQEAKNQSKNINILNDINCQVQQPKHLRYESKNDIRAKFLQRKYIGQYAKTIKTFNESESKEEDNQSIVIQRAFAFPGQFPAAAFNRVTTREEPRSLQSQDIKRQYSSFGELKQESSQMERNLFRQYVSHPIYQNSFDSQKQN